MIARLFSLFLFLSPFLLAQTADPTSQTPDPKSRSFEYLGEKKKVDCFDFPGEWPNLEHIDIDATRKYRIEFNLTGVYQKLEDVRYKGSFGTLNAKLTGSFFLLSTIDFAVGSTESLIDLRGNWHKECDIHIRSTKGDITLILPKTVGYEIVAKIGPRGKVETPLKKLGRGWLERHYANTNYPKKLNLVVETTEGTIKINEKD